MAKSEYLKIILSAVDKATKPIKQVSGSIWVLNKKLKDNQKSFQKMAVVWWAVFTGLALWIKSTVAWYSDLVEINQKFGVVYSDMSKEADKTAKNLSDNYGLSSRGARGYLADIGDLVSWLWYTQEASLDFWKNVVELWTDLASFSNVAWWSEEAIDRLKKWLLGEHENLKALGIQINENMVKTQLLADWTDHLTGVELMQAKVQARMTLALSQSKNAIGDFARSKESLANVTRIVQAKMQDLTDGLWKLFYPIILQITTALVPLVEKMAKWVENNQELAKVIIIAVGAISGLALVFGTLGLILPSIIGGFSAMITVIKWVWIALRFLALNPVWMIITAIWLAVVAWVAIYKNWDTIKKGAKALWDKIVSLYNDYWMLLWPLFIVIELWKAIYRNFGAIKTASINLGKGIANLYEKYKWLLWPLALIIEAWKLVYKNWDKIKEWASQLLSSLGTFFTDLGKSAMEWGWNLISMFLDWIKAKTKALQDWIANIASSIADYLWFHSPTKKGPNSDADKWMPNLINMLSKGLENWEWEVKKASEWIAEQINKWMSNIDLEQVEEALWDIQMTALSVNEEIKWAISGQKSKVLDLVDEYKNLKQQIADIDTNIGGIKSGGETQIAERAIELEKQLADIKKSIKDEEEYSAKKILKEKQLQLQTELELAKNNTTQTEIDNIRLENAKSETQKLIEKTALKVAEAEAEKVRITELAELKRQEAITEHEEYKALLEEKKVLDKEYFNIFWAYIKKTNNWLDVLIEKMRKLNAMRGASSSGTSGSRVTWWPVSKWRTYRVNERWEEFFTAPSNWKIIPNGWLWGGGQVINISVTWNNISNEADENRLVDKIKDSLARDISLASNFGIA